jgi:hypothetical protein
MVNSCFPNDMHVPRAVPAVSQRLASKFISIMGNRVGGSIGIILRCSRTGNTSSFQ